MANETTTLATSAYALVSLTRNLGTPTSDLRATSPSNYQQPSSCFWAILDDQLKLLFIDPTLPNTHQQQLTLNQLIPPNDYQNIKSKLPQQQQHQHQHQSTIIGHPQSSIRTPIRCNFLRHTHLIRLLTTTESNSTQSDDRHQPTDLILHPIPHGRFLAFFHSQQQQQQQVPNPPYSPWITNFHPCGLKQSDNNHYLNQDQVYQLQRALTQSQSPPPPNFPLEPTPLEIFLIIDSRTARVLFSHHYSILTDHHHHHQFSPEDYAYFAMQSKSLETQNNNNNHEHTNCSRQLTAQHQLVKDGMVINILQSFVIEYGNLTFASFKSTPTSRPQTMSNQQQSIIKPSPLELVHDHSHPIPLDLYSPTSSQLAHKRPRTDSCSEVLTPQSACSTHSQSYPYNQPPSAHHQYSTSSFNTNNNNNNNNNPHHHHHHHHHHHPSPQLSSLTSTISIPESPDAYGYTHFSGELSPTMASAANVLGSFHRAHYHQPQSILALQNPAPTPSTNLIGGYESYGLQNLASMATSSAPFEPPPPLPPPPPPPPQPDFSSSSNSSSPLHSEFNPFSFSSSKDSSTRLPPPSLNPPSSSSSSSHSIGLNNHRQQHPSDDELCSYPPQPLHSLDSHPHHHHLHHHHSSTRLPYLDNPHTLKRPRSAILDPPPNKPTPSLERNHPAGGTTTTASATTTTATVRACTSCGAQNSPEWRKGPNGVKSLCNACGLRFSRAQARKSKAPKPANKKLHSQYPPPSTPLALQSLSPQSSAPGPTLMAKKKIGFAAGTPTPSSGSLNDHTHHSVDRSIHSPASSFVVAEPVGGPSDSSIVDRFSR